MALVLTGFSAIFTGVNLVATIFYLRAPGMTMFRMPIFTWNMLVTAILILIAFPVLTSALVMLFCDRHFGTHIFSVQGGGSPILWQNLFWFFGHPEVYILALPYFGIVTEVIPVFSRKPVFGYKGMVFATLAIAALSTGVWAHHMFTTGVVLLPFFSLLSLLIAVPTGIKFFNWIGTMWRGQIRYSTRRCSSRIGFLFAFLMGGVTGVMLAPRRSTSSPTTPTSSWPTSTRCCSARRCSPASPASTTGIRSSSAGCCARTSASGTSG